MKKIISTVLVCVLLLGTLLTLASCAKTVRGTYTGELNLGITTVHTELAFDGNAVKITSGVGNVAAIYNATYEITEAEDGSMTITFTYAEGADEHSIFNGEMSFSEITENDVKYIKLGALKLQEKKD